MAWRITSVNKHPTEKLSYKLYETLHELMLPPFILNHNCKLHKQRKLECKISYYNLVSSQYIRLLKWVQDAALHCKTDRSIKLSQWFARFSPLCWTSYTGEHYLVRPRRGNGIHQEIHQRAQMNLIPSSRLQTTGLWVINIKGLAVAFCILRQFSCFELIRTRSWGILDSGILKIK